MCCAPSAVRLLRRDTLGRAGIVRRMLAGSFVHLHIVRILSEDDHALERAAGCRQAAGEAGSCKGRQMVTHTAGPAGNVATGQATARGQGVREGKHPNSQARCLARPCKGRATWHRALPPAALEAQRRPPPPPPRPVRECTPLTRNVFLGAQLRALAHRQQHRRGVRLEACGAESSRRESEAGFGGPGRALHAAALGPAPAAPAFPSALGCAGCGPRPACAVGGGIHT